MKRRAILSTLITWPLILQLPAASAKQKPQRTAGETNLAGFAPLAKSKDEWRALLERNRFEILFEEDTERAFASSLNDEQRAGTYICAACYLPLFYSKHKYDSGTGWPSFTRPIEGAMAKRTDYKLIFPRTEYHCARCGGHQGHVFKDGPAPRRERWCNNGLALLFVPRTQELPSLRT